MGPSTKLEQYCRYVAEFVHLHRRKHTLTQPAEYVIGKQKDRVCHLTSLTRPTDFKFLSFGLGLHFFFIMTHIVSLSACFATTGTHHSHTHITNSALNCRRRSTREVSRVMNEAGFWVNRDR
jgi:hypothetical protein